jgi:DNA-binding MarR family transcriptional regulator
MAKQKSDESPVQALERLTRLVRAGEHTGDLNPAQWGALRYLSRCNRFSNSPAALTRYLGATKGTISQSLIALERKGLVEKSPRSGEARSVALTLTPAGESRLAEDPWAVIDTLLGQAGGKGRKKFAAVLGDLLEALTVSRGLPSFGVCASCRYFREGGAPDEVKGKHWCLKFEEPVTKTESEKICASHDPA